MVGCAGILVSDTLCGPLKELPAPGQLLAVDSLPTKVGGCAANVAIDLARQEIETDVVGCLGRDSSAQSFLAQIEQYRVGTKHIVYSETLPTSRTVILLVEGEDRRYVHSFGANAAFTVDMIDREWVKTLDVFYLGGLFLMPGFSIDEFIDLLHFCRKSGVTTVVDVVIPAGTRLPEDLAPLLQASDYFLPNVDEGVLLTGTADPFEQLRFFSGLGAHTIVVTLGESGAILCRGGIYSQAGIYSACDGVDPSGSGDAFAAGLITAIVRGWELPEMIRYASALGASANCALGTTEGVFTRQQAESFIASHDLSLKTGKL